VGRKYQRDEYDPFGVRVSTFNAIRALDGDDAAPVRWRSALVENLISRLDAARTPVSLDVDATRRAVVFLLRGRLVSNNGRTNPYAMEEVTAPDVVREVTDERVVRHARLDLVAARGGRGWPACPVCDQPVDPAAQAGTRAKAHPMCDPGGVVRELHPRREERR
jgi:hypothetical protein